MQRRVGETFPLLYDYFTAFPRLDVAEIAAEEKERKKKDPRDSPSRHGKHGKR